MLKIVESTNRRAVRALLAPERVRDAATDRRVAKIVGDVRGGGDAALIKYAAALDRLDGPIEVGSDEMRRTAKTVDASVRRAIREAASLWSPAPSGRSEVHWVYEYDVGIEPTDPVVQAAASAALASARSDVGLD